MAPALSAFFARFPAALLFVLLVTLGALPAHADAIDGDWCHPKVGRLVISGPNLTTPAGRRITGNYDRHAFSYVVPPGEPGAGKTTTMQLYGEHRMDLTPAAGGAVQVWRRCGAPAS